MIRAFLLVAIAVAASVEANFAAAPGFSGRVADCTSCHRPPLEGDDAVVRLEGIPEAWDLGGTYTWTVAVDGGPVTLPGGPQAGFELEVLAGRVTPTGEGVRSFYEKQATYTEEGVFQRSWDVTWTAPDLSSRPAPVTVWLAGLAANGNHNVMLNASDAGEHGDSADAAVYTIPPSTQAIDAWRSLPLLAPVLDRVDSSGDRHVVHGRNPDANATHIEVRDGDGWISRPAAGSWRLAIVGPDTVTVRAAGADRVSANVTIDLEAGMAIDAEVLERSTPAPFLLLPLFLALWRRP